MIQIELDNQEAQLQKNLSLMTELDRVPTDRAYSEVAFGSLVKSTSGIYFISIGLGQVQIEDSIYFVISLSSPIGELLRDKSIGDRIEFRGATIEILAID